MKERIDKLIKYLNITQKEFASSSGIAQGTLTDLLKGRTKTLSSETIANIYKAYSVNPIWLLTGEGEMFLNKKYSSNVNNSININSENSGNIIVSSEEKEILEQLRKKKNKKILDAIKVLLGAGVVFGLLWLVR